MVLVLDEHPRNGLGGRQPRVDWSGNAVDLRTIASLWLVSAHIDRLRSVMLRRHQSVGNEYRVGEVVLLVVVGATLSGSV